MESVKREPVMKLEAERLWGGAGEYAVSFEKAGWLDECRRKGGTFLLYTQPDWADFDRLTAENQALQQRLTVQDQRVDDLESKLEECITEMFLALEDHAVRSAMTVVGRTRFLELVKAHHATLKPTAEAESHE